MNREFLFKGKVVKEDSKIWIIGRGAYKIDTAEYLVLNSKGKCVKVINLCQYTGLKDMYEKKIFEKDILKSVIPDGTIRYFVVEWANEDRILRPLSNFVPDGNPIRISGWCFNWNGHRLYPTVMDGVPDNERMEIVGNIYDNPELINGYE